MATTARIEHAGDLDARPLLRVYGPITAPRATFSTYNPAGAEVGSYQVGFTPSFVVDAGHYVEIDSTAYTAAIDGDPTRPAEQFLVWPSLRWPVLAPIPSYSIMRLDGSSTSEISQVQALWQDGFLI